MVKTGGIFGFIILILDIWAIIKVVQSSASAINKAIWIAVILVVPVVGLIVWYFAGPKGG